MGQQEHTISLRGFEMKYLEKYYCNQNYIKPAGRKARLNAHSLKERLLFFA